MVVLPIVAFYVLRNKNMGAETEQQVLPVRAMLCISMAVAFVIGMYDGFYGPGTGTFYLLILTGIAHLNVHQASAMTKILNLTSNLVALINFLLNGTAYYGLGMAAAVFCIAGNYIGSGLVVNDTGSLRDTVYPVDISFHVDYHGAFQGEERDGHAVGLFHGNDLERT